MTWRSTLSVVALSLVSAACPSPEFNPFFQREHEAGILAGEPVNADDEIAASTVGIEAPGYGVYCTGVLVAPNLVATAAHCTGITTRPNLLNIVFGVDLTENPERRQVLGGRVSPLWPQLQKDQVHNWGDIAILKFDGTHPYGFKPAKMLESAELLSDGMEVILAGYGVTQVNPQEMSETLMKVTVLMTQARFSETEILFSHQNGKGACHGDSGGPAFARIDQSLYVIGVTSRSATVQGALNCEAGSLSTSIPAHGNFLRSAAEELNSPDFQSNQPMPQPQLNPPSNP